MECNKLRINDVVELTGLSRNTLYRYMREDSLKYTEINGIRYLEQSDVDTLIVKKTRVKSDITDDTLSDVSVLCNAIYKLTNEISNISNLLHNISVSKLCNDVALKEQPKKESVSKGVTGNVSGDNIRRQNEAYTAVVEVLESYIESGKRMPMQKEMAAQAGVSPDTFRKHHNIWKNKTA